MNNGIDLTVPITGYNPNMIVSDGTGLPPKEQQIQGEMFTAQKVYIQEDFEIYGEKFIKGKLAEELFNFIKESGYIEFTKQQRLDRHEMLVRARMFVVPDSQVRLLRLNGVK